MVLTLNARLQGRMRPTDHTKEAVALTYRKNAPPALPRPPAIRLNAITHNPTIRMPTRTTRSFTATT